MVVKHVWSYRATITPFESRVILDGSQTLSSLLNRQRQFESRVILDGSQTGT